MSPVMVILRREVQGYFVSPIAYTAIAGFLFIGGFGFNQAMANYTRISPATYILQEIALQSHFIPRMSVWITVAMLLCLPAVSMRLFSEERKGGTIELLLTSPLTTAQLVIGKYAGTLVVFACMLVLTFPFLIVLASVGHPEWGAIATTYLGYFLFGAVLLAIGVFASTVTENQIIAVVITYALFMPFFVVDLLINWVSTGVGDVLAGVSLMVARRSLTRGIVDTHVFVMHAALIFVFLFLSARVLDSKRWR